VSLRVFFWLAFGATLLVSCHAWAAPCETSRLIRPGWPAPCQGLLVPELEARTAALCVAVDLPQCRTLRQTERQECAIRLAAEHALRVVVAIERDSLRVLLDEALTVQPIPRPWYEHPAFVATLSAVGAAGLTIGILYLSGAM